MKLQRKVKTRGVSIVPLSMYFTPKGLVKIEIAIVKGKREYGHSQNCTVDSHLFERIFSVRFLYYPRFDIACQRDSIKATSSACFRKSCGNDWWIRKHPWNRNISTNRNIDISFSGNVRFLCMPDQSSFCMRQSIYAEEWALNTMLYKY